MTEDDVAELLEEIEQMDTRRTFDRRQVESWHRVAVAVRWNLAGSLRAVADHYADSNRWIMPADITKFLREPGESGQRICEY